MSVIDIWANTRPRVFAQTSMTDILISAGCLCAAFSQFSLFVWRGLGFCVNSIDFSEGEILLEERLHLLDRLRAQYGRTDVSAARQTAQELGGEHLHPSDHPFFRHVFAQIVAEFQQQI